MGHRLVAGHCGVLRTVLVIAPLEYRRRCRHSGALGLDSLATDSHQDTISVAGVLKRPRGAQFMRLILTNATWFSPPFKLPIIRSRSMKRTAGWSSGGRPVRVLVYDTHLATAA